MLAALKAGLTAEDIIGYLRSQAHPHVAVKSPVVPEVRLSQQTVPSACKVRVVGRGTSQSWRHAFRPGAFFSMCPAHVSASARIFAGQRLAGSLRARAAMGRALCLQVVSDQIRLWHAETRRVRDTPAVLYGTFESEARACLTHLV